MKGKHIYDHRAIDAKWQKFWAENHFYEARDFSSKKATYILIEFPYPSGERLHVGHVRSYVGMDVVSRKRRLQGENVLYPIGWDAFGLPAENYAIKTGIHPSITTKGNIANAKKQVKSWGISFDWKREINTSDPEYYRFTQWIFLKLYEKGLAYRAEIPVNWCPSCKINLANEEVINGNCERCGSQTSRKMQQQWLLKITAYADRLLDDLKTVDYREDIKRQQINWIGRKEGVNITYPLEGSQTVTVFTTRPDTNFGATFIVLAPEHPLAEKIATAEQKETVREYLRKTREKSELERIQEGRKKTGVFTGRYAINQLNGSKMPIWLGDFVLKDVGTGALVGVPGHDRRDFEFAREFNLEIKRVVVGPDGDRSAITKIEQVQEEHGTMVNSGFLDGLDIHAATKKIIDYLTKKGHAKKAVSYHLRDWVFSRQHYWGEPIPIIHCPKCGEVKVPEKDLPVKLPHVQKYQPTDTGESPLAVVSSWVNTTCPQCHGPAKRETDTMPNWAGSSWYFLRYLDPKNQTVFADKKKLAYWLPVDWYNGGLEHTTLHLLYSRFWHKFLYDLGFVPTSEPYAKRTSHGVILGPDGNRMSKSKGNVINPDDVVRDFGADVLRVYEMFMGPFDQTIAWDAGALIGVRRFLEKIWKLGGEKLADKKENKETALALNNLAKKVSTDIESLKFNTAVAAMMQFINENGAKLTAENYKTFLLLLSPFAPHLTEELWEKLGGKKSIHLQNWPSYSSKNIQGETAEIIIQINGKVRDLMVLSAREANEEKTVAEKAKGQEKVKKYLQGKTVKKTVFIPRRLINFVI